MMYIPQCPSCKIDLGIGISLYPSTLYGIRDMFTPEATSLIHVYKCKQCGYSELIPSAPWLDFNGTPNPQYKNIRRGLI